MLGALAPRQAIERHVERLLTPFRADPSRIPQVPQALTFHRRIDSGAYRLSAWEWGRGPAVLLLHDWNREASDLEALVPPLLAAGYRVIAADLPAHGHSTGTFATLRDWRRAVQSLALYAGGLEAIVAQGLGATAALWAAQSLNVRRMVLLAPREDLAGGVRRALAARGVPRRLVEPVLRALEERLGAGLATLETRRLIALAHLPALLTLGPVGSELRLARGMPRVSLPFHAAGGEAAADPALLAEVADFLNPDAEGGWHEPVAPEYSLAM